ncbi:MAG: hypothetical protein JW797_11545 [Bradymonadales bacterium]|nr:hypothetical protein [Bradymonadales bacterium]
MNENVLKKSRVLELLVRDGALTPRQAHQALRAQDAGGGNLLDILIESESMQEVALARALGQAFQIPLIDLTKARVTKPALRRASGEFCRRHQILPFCVDPHTGELLVAISDPEQRTAIEALRFRNNQSIRTHIAPRRQLREAIQYYYFSGAVPELASPPKKAPITKPHIPISSPAPDTGKHSAQNKAPEPVIPVQVEPEVRSEAASFFLGPPVDDPGFLEFQEQAAIPAGGEEELFSTSQMRSLSPSDFPRAESDLVNGKPLQSVDQASGPFGTTSGAPLGGAEPYGPFSPIAASGPKAPPPDRVIELERALQRLEQTVRNQRRAIQYLAQQLLQQGLLSTEQLEALLDSVRD